MKRLAAAVIVVIVLVALAIASIPFLMSPGRMSNAVVATIESWTGRAVTLGADAEISVYPDVSVTASDLTVAGLTPDGSPLLSARRITATVRLLPLLFGRIEMRDLHLQAPRLRLERTAGGVKN
ncbi:MAG: AsmA family protein, partial [Alphaproteobacteria bacterium]